MALPANGLLSTPTRAAGFISPRNQLRVPLVDTCRGGLAFNNATRGLDVYEWRFTYDAPTRGVYAEVVGQVAPTLVHTLPADAEEIAGSFDTNMQPVIGWVTTAGAAAFRWFDPIAVAFVVVPLAAGTYNVRIVLDDVRPGQTGTGATDTIITYLRGDSLYYRQLRDRFEDEYELRDGLTDYRIGQFGMNRKFRLQWQVYKPVIV